jgi:hypothetical protein
MVKVATKFTFPNRKHKYSWKNIRKDFGKDGMRCSRRWKYPYKSEYCYPYE